MTKSVIPLSPGSDYPPAFWLQALCALRRREPNPLCAPALAEEEIEQCKNDNLNGYGAEEGDIVMFDGKSLKVAECHDAHIDEQGADYQQRSFALSGWSRGHTASVSFMYLESEGLNLPAFR